MRNQPAPPRGLAAYDQARRARITMLVKAASQHRDAKTAGPIGRRRNQLLTPIFFSYFYQRATRWLHVPNQGSQPTFSNPPGGQG